MGTRKAARQRLAAIFASQGFNVVYSYAPTDLAGATKALCIYTDSSNREQLSKHMINDFHDIVLDVYVKRESGINTEDTLDDLHAAVLVVIQANVDDSAWNELTLEDKSDCMFAEVAGLPYRVERHIVHVKIST